MARKKRMQITSIGLTSMTMNESFQFHTAIYGYFKECSFLEVTAFEDNYRDAIEKYDVAIKQVLQSDKTIHLAELDSVRDTIYRNFVKTNNVALLHFDHDVADAAHSVEVVIKNYKNPVKMSYASETSVIYNLCQDLQSPTYAPAVAKAGLTEWVVQLKEANENFDKLFNERSDEQSVLIVGLAKEARVHLELCYETLMLVTEAELLKPSCPLQAYVDRINEQISYYKALIAARKTRNATKRKNKKEEDKNEEDKNEGPIEI